MVRSKFTDRHGLRIWYVRSLRDSMDLVNTKQGNFPNEKTYEDNKYWYCDKPVLEQKWKQIPDDIHILITHSPRYRTLDGVYGFGCSHLAHRVSELSSLRVHCFGHVHMSYGNKRDGDLLSINAAVDDEEQPHVFEYFY